MILIGTRTTYLATGDAVQCYEYATPRSRGRISKPIFSTARRRAQTHKRRAMRLFYVPGITEKCVFQSHHFRRACNRKSARKFPPHSVGVFQLLGPVVSVFFVGARFLSGNVWAVFSQELLGKRSLQFRTEWFDTPACYQCMTRLWFQVSMVDSACCTANIVAAAIARTIT